MLLLKEVNMDIEERSHAAINYVVGGTAASSPWWLNFIQITDPVVHWLTGIIGLVLVLVQFSRTVNKRR